MAVGTGIGFDISQLDAAIKSADEALKTLGKTGKSAAKQLDEAFALAKSGNIQDFISVIDRLSNSLGKKGYNQAAQMVREIASETTGAIDRVNRFASLMQTISEGGRSYVKNGAIESLKYQLDEALSRLGVLNERLQFYTKGEGAKAVNANVVDTSALQDEANKLRVVVELLQRRLEHEQALAALKQRSGAIENQQALNASWQKMEEERAKQLQQQSINAKEANKAYEQAYNDRYQMYAVMYDKMWQEDLKHFERQNANAKSGGQQYAKDYEEKTRYYERWINEEFLKEQEKNKRIAESKLAEERRINQQISQDRIDQLGRESQQRQKIEQMIRDTQKRNHDQRQKELEDLFREQERQAKAQAKYDSASRRERYKAYTTSYEGAIKTSDRVKTLTQEIQAVKNLEAARAKLNKTDADYKKKLDDINARIRRHNKNIAEATEGARELEKAHNSLGSKIATVFSIQAISGYINKMIQVRGEMELQQRSLQAILQNKDAANEVWQKTIDLAVRSPFRIKDLVTYTKQLAAYRVESDKLYETNKMLADVSAGLGVDMNRLILAFGQVKAANFLRGTELRQFTEAGIPMLDELAKHFNDMNDTALTSADVFDMISKRMVLFEDVEAVFERMTRAGGTFYRMQEIQSETLRGQISNLKDSLDIMLNDIGRANDGVLKTSVKAVKLLVDNYELMIPVLKTIIASLALYKISAFTSSKATLRLARDMNLARISANGFAGMWTSLRVNWALFNKGLDKTLAMLSKNPWLVWIAGAAAVYFEVNKIVKQFKAIDKAYNDMLNQQTEITAKFFKAEDVDTQKKALKELVDFANKEYDFGIKIDLKEIPDSEVGKYMNDLRDKMVKANAFGATFQKELIGANLKTRWNFADGDWNFLVPIEQGMNKDIDQMGDAYDNLNRILVNNLSPTIDALSSQLGGLNEDQRKALDSLKAGIGEWDKKDEDMVEYFDRIRGNYESIVHLLDKSDNIADKKIARQLRKYKRRYSEAEREFKVFIEGIDENIMGVKEEDRTLFLNAAIDDAKAEKNWSEFEEKQIRKWLEKKYEIELTPKIATQGEGLKAWQDSYNELFAGRTGFRAINSIETSQKQVIEQLNAQYESTAELLERIQLAGEDSVLEGGAYEGENLAKLKNDLVDIKEQLDWFGANAKKDDKKESASIKILQKRINLLKEVNKKYLELEKTFDAVTAKEKVMEAYSDTFREAFAGTGVDLDLYKVMTQVITDSKEIGENAGSSFSEGMIKKLKELEDAGTYIRSFTKELIEATKEREGFVGRAYDDMNPQKILKEGDKIIGTLTKGYGTTNNAGLGNIVKIGDIIDEKEAEELLIKTYELKAKSLNKILDTHRELIITQEQYNELLDAFYQGEAGTKKAIDLAFSEWESFERYINGIKDLPQLNKKALLIDVDQLKAEWEALDTYQEKLAFTLKWTNITTKVEEAGKKVRKLSSAMQERSAKRSAIFSGDLDIAKQLETVLVRVAGMDFTTTEGMIEALGKLKEIAEKEGPEAKNILSQAISGLEAEIGLRVKKEANKELNDEVQALFDRYELTVDLKKLNLPREAAEELFDVKYLDLDGLRKAVQDKASEFVGTDQYEKYQEYLDKIDEMERKSIIERTKTYAEYLNRGMNERVKLKIEELRKLKELEESKEFNPDQKEQIRGQIKADTQKALDKESWKQFQGTEWYTLMFADLETLGTQAIKNLRDELSQLKDSLTHLDPSDVKEIVNQMEKLEEQLIKRNPFDAFVTARQKIKGLEQSEEEVMSQLKVYEAEKARAQDVLDRLAEIEVARAEYSLGDLQGETLELFHRLRAEVLAGNTNAFKDARKEYQDLLDAAEAGIELTSEQQKIFTDYRKSLQGIAEYWGEINGQIQDIVGGAVNIMEAYGIEESTKVIAESVGHMSTLITQAIQFGAQMQEVGYASNMALGVIGWIAMGIQAVSTIISSIANYKNAKIDKQLERQAKLIEQQRDLYEEIEKKVESAYSVDQLRQYNSELERSVELEIQALEASIAMERSRKKADKDQIAEWEKAIAEARERLAESKQEIMEELGGMFDITDFAKDFVDAWWNAMDEGKSGLDALSKHFEQTMKDLVKNQALYKGASTIMKQVQDAINADLADDFEIDNWQSIFDVAQKANADLDAFLKGWYNMFGGLSTGASGLSALQKGIQGITEETAQVIEAYMNSIRGYVSEQVTHTRNIYRILNDAVHSDAAAIRVRMV